MPAIRTVKAKLCALGSLPFAVAGLACEGGAGTDVISLDQLPRIQLTEELRIGSVDDPELGFTRIGDHIEVGVGDSIYVAETSAPEIRVYSPDGVLIRRIGRRGEGPGEFGYIGYWGLVGDTIWVLERSRVTLYRGDGSLMVANTVEPIWIEKGPYRISLGPSSMRGNGHLVLTLQSYTAPNPDLPDMDVRIPTLLADINGDVIDTIGYRTLELGTGDRPFRRVGSLPFTIPQTDYPRSYPLAHAGESDTLFVGRLPAESAESGRLTVTRMSGADTVLHRELRYSPVSVPESYRDSVIDTQVESMGRFGDPKAIREAMEEMFRFAAFFPPVSDLTVTGDGSIWLLRQPVSEDSSTWMLLDPSGEPRGEMVAPPGTEILWSDGAVLYVSERDELEIPWLVRYRMGLPD